MSPSLSPLPPRLRNSESLACSSSSSTSISSSSASSAVSTLFDRNSRTSSEWSDITPPTSPSHSLDGAVKSMHGVRSLNTIKAPSKATFSESLPTLLENEDQPATSYPPRLTKTRYSSANVRGAPRKAHSVLRRKQLETIDTELQATEKAVDPPQLIITSPDEDVEEWTESLQTRQDEASALQADVVPSAEDSTLQGIESDESFSIESTIEAWLDRAQKEGKSFPGVESLLDEQFDFPSFPSSPELGSSLPPQPSPPRSATVFRPILEPVPEDRVAPGQDEIVAQRPATFWVLEPLPSPSLAPVPEEEEEELQSPESTYTLPHTIDPSETDSLLLDADVDFSMPPTPRINPMNLGDADFSPLVLGSPKIRTLQTPSPRTPLSPRNRRDILHLASPLTTPDDSSHMQSVDVPAMMRLEIARTLADSRIFGQFAESASGLGLGLELTSEETSFPPALFPTGLQLQDSSILQSSVLLLNDSSASDGPHHTLPSEAREETKVVDSEIVGLGLGKVAEAGLQSSSSVTSKMDDECLAELYEVPLSTTRDQQLPLAETQAANRLEQHQVNTAQHGVVLEAVNTLPSTARHAVSMYDFEVLQPRSALSLPRDAEQSSSPSPSSSPSAPSKAPGALSSHRVLYTQIRSSRLPAPRLSPIPEGDSFPEISGIVDGDGDFVIVPSPKDGDVPFSPLAELWLANEHPETARYPVQSTPKRGVIRRKAGQQVAQLTSEFPPINARARGSRGALHPLLFEPTLESGSKIPDASRVTTAPSTSTPLTGYPGISKIPAPRGSKLEGKPHSFSSSSPPSSLPMRKAPFARKVSTGGSKVPQKAEVERAPSKNKKPAATKLAPAPVKPSAPSTSYFSRLGLHLPSFAREYDDPALRTSISSVLSSSTDPRSPTVEGPRIVVPPALVRKAVTTSASGHNPPARSSLVKSTKSLGGLGKGLPSHLASRAPVPRNASSSSSNRPLSSSTGTSAPAAAANRTVEPAGPSSARRSTSPPKRYLQIAKFAKRQLYVIPEVPTPSPTFSAVSPGPNSILQSPKKPGVLRRLLSPKKSPSVPDASPTPTASQQAVTGKAGVPQARRSSIPQPRQLPSRVSAAPTGPSPLASAKPQPPTTAVSDTQDLPAATDPGRSPLPFIEHADAPRTMGLLKRSTNRVSLGDNSRSQLGSPLTRKLRSLF